MIQFATVHHCWRPSVCSSLGDRRRALCIISCVRHLRVGGRELSCFFLSACRRRLAQLSMTAVFAPTIYLRVQCEQGVGRLNGHGLGEAVSLTDLLVLVSVVIGMRGEGSSQLREHVVL